MVTVFASSGGRYRAGTVTLFGEEVVSVGDLSLRPQLWLPIILKCIAPVEVLT